jgi:hypothetical protein
MDTCLARLFIQRCKACTAVVLGNDGSFVWNQRDLAVIFAKSRTVNRRSRRSAMQSSGMHTRFGHRPWRMRKPSMVMQSRIQFLSCPFGIARESCLQSVSTLMLPITTVEPSSTRKLLGLALLKFSSFQSPAQRVRRDSWPFLCGFGRCGLKFCFGH